MSEEQTNTEQSNQIHLAILQESADTVDPSIMVKLLSSDAVIDADGNISVNGNDIKSAVADLLKDKPFLAKNTVVNNPARLSAVERINMARKQQGGK